MYVGFQSASQAWINELWCKSIKCHWKLLWALQQTWLKQLDRMEPYGIEPQGLKMEAGRSVEHHSEKAEW